MLAGFNPLNNINDSPKSENRKPAIRKPESTRGTLSSTDANPKTAATAKNQIRS